MTALYCPATLRRMRSMADGQYSVQMAATLGWPIETVRSACGKHCFDLLNTGAPPSAERTPQRIAAPADDVRSKALFVGVTPPLAAAIRAAAKQRNASVSRVCFNILAAAMGEGLP